MRLLLLVLLVTAHAWADSPLDALSHLSRSTHWTIVQTIPLHFPAFHPQGLVRHQDHFYLTSVDTQAHQGHLFVFDSTGQLQTDVPLGRGDDYHPGGIDCDGQALWVPVAEYRPDSHALIYRVDLRTLRPELQFEVNDHVGALSCVNHQLQGATWGSRRFFTWTVKGHLLSQVDNRSHYIDFQDCKHVEGPWTLCSGLSETIEGLEVVNLRTGERLIQVPMTLKTPADVPMLRNPMTWEWTGDRLRLYVVPEDDASTLYVLEP
ncbi:MAG TPA: DUF6454 family protein [Candidatus Xenobia bacterium]|jgi:hypothetical protein